MIMGKEGWIRYRSFLMSNPGREWGVTRAEAKLQGFFNILCKTSFDSTGGGGPGPTKHLNLGLNLRLSLAKVLVYSLVVF